ncbi:hypothetical protein [Brevibacterium spongiae]|uniref:Endonuclease domain-containing protein n=1 Tax=Brevibacterium spongiae TaxID=2909672 RepID=A0ABY5SVE1_9MICO|nr:hypothetical protein [Brevibacterium spongiae]UVI37113.1 endonuclease domain-containing protein [Brevibacterium spongiae]
MYNVVRTSELRACGVQSRCIRDAIGCCLLALTQGMYSIVARCSNPRHSAIAEFVTDEAWITRVIEQTDQKTGKPRFELLDMFETLRVASYPHYGVDDVIWGVSAGFVHDFPLYRPPRGTVFIAHPTRRHCSSDVVRTTRSVPEEDVVQIGKMSLTSPVRTAFDLIGQLGEPEGFAALERCLRRSTFGSDAGAAEAARFGYPPDTLALGERRIAEDFMPVLRRLSKGQSRAQCLLSAIGPLSESYAESRFVYNLMQLRLTGFSQQARIRDGREVVARVDFLHRESRTIVLVDGFSKYADNGVGLMRKEVRQYNRLLEMGYRIIRLNFTEVANLEECATKLFAQAPHLRAFIAPRKRSGVR